jgi:hypothetical protein
VVALSVEVVLVCLVKLTFRRAVEVRDNRQLVSKWRIYPEALLLTHNWIWRLISLLVYDDKLRLETVLMRRTLPYLGLWDPALLPHHLIWVSFLGLLFLSKRVFLFQIREHLFMGLKPTRRVIIIWWPLLVWLLLKKVKFGAESRIQLCFISPPILLRPVVETKLSHRGSRRNCGRDWKDLLWTCFLYTFVLKNWAFDLFNHRILDNFIFMLKVPLYLVKSHQVCPFRPWSCVVFVLQVP